MSWNNQIFNVKSKRLKIITRIFHNNYVVKNFEIFCYLKQRQGIDSRLVLVIDLENLMWYKN